MSTKTTTGIDPEPPWRRPWAAHKLGVAAEASPEAVRAAFLTRLSESKFTPPAAIGLAFEILSGRRAWNDERPAEEQAALTEVEPQLRAAVEEFAAKYWAVPPVARHQHWQALWERCSWWPPLRERLEALKTGLEVESSLEDLPGVVELAAYIRELYVLLPSARAVRWREILSGVEPISRLHRKTARRLRKQYPALAALEPVLLDRWINPPRPRAIPRLNKKAARKAPSWVVIVCILAALTLVRALNERSNDQRRTQPVKAAPQWPRSGGVPLAPETRDFWEKMGRGGPAFIPKEASTARSPVLRSTAPADR